MPERVAIVGLAFRFPGTTTQNYWADLLAGRNLVGTLDARRWPLDACLHPDQKHPGTAYTRAAGSLGDVAGFDAEFFGISPREAALMDPQQRVLLELSWEALENAGLVPARLRGSDCGVYVGIASTDYAWRLAEDLDSIDAATITGNAPSIAANRLSYFYDWRGPGMAIDTACSSALVAFHQACQAIAGGQCSMALAGGISLHLHPYGFIGFSKAGMLSRSGRCRVFDAAADGYVRSEGGGLFVLKNYAQALRDGDPVWAVVAASAVNTDGADGGKPALTVPAAQAQAALMRQALAQAGMEAGQIDYLEAHGTGTPVGDPIETHAIGLALGRRRGANQPLPIGSVKSNMGHLETASGVAGLVKALYALRHRVVPATIGVERVNPHIKLDAWNLDIVTTNRALRPHGPLVIGVNSFGFGGANAHVIVQSAPEIDAPMHAPAAAPASALPLIITGKSAAAVCDYAARLADALQEGTVQDFYDAAWHLARRRQWHAQRAVLFAASGPEAAARLRALAETDIWDAGADAGPGEEKAETPAPVFAYCGNGAQWAGMGRSLLQDAVFAAAVAAVDALFQPLAGWSLAEELAGKNDVEGANRYERTEIAQPALFAVQVGITRMLAQWGVRPAAVIGHSVGEVAAAWACGALTLADAVCVIYQRSRLQGLTKGSGQMAALGLGPQAAQALLHETGLGAQLHIAAVNSAHAVTLAGTAQALDALQRHVAQARAKTVFLRLALDYAFHSPAMDGIESGVRAALARIAPRRAPVAFYSTVTGGVLDGARLDADYWWRNIRCPVQFAAAAQAAGAGGAIFVEIGPHPLLRSYLQDVQEDAQEDVQHALPGSRRSAIATGQRHDDAPQRIRAAAARVLASGARVDWGVFFPRPARPGGSSLLPAYAWQREAHWHPTSAQAAGLLTRAVLHPLLGWALRQSESAAEAAWENRLDTQAQPLLADHVVGDAPVFPAAGYAELALAAAHQWRAGSVEIEDLEIRAPLLLAQAPAQRLRTLLDKTDGRLRILAKKQGADADWVLHATCRVLHEADSAWAQHTPALPPPAGAADFDAARHATLTRALGLHYGAAFCTITHGWREAPYGVRAALAVPAAVAQELRQELAHMHLHPALLDAAFQLVVHLLPPADMQRARQQGIALVPVQIGRLLLRGVAGVPCSARACLRQRTPRSVLADCTLYDAHGAPLACARGVRFRAVRLRQGAQERLQYFDWHLTPRPLQGGAPAAVDAARLQQELAACMADDTSNTGEGGQARAVFHGEVAPLLESLCDQWARDALPALDALETLNTTPAPPQHAALRAHVRQRALQADKDSSATAAAIWNTLLREYPDWFAAIHAAGRIGLHLPALLRAEMAAEAPCLPASTPAALSRLLCGAPLLHRLGRVLEAALCAAQAAAAPGQRLAVLEIGADAPLFAHACRKALDAQRADYTCAAPDAAALDALARQWPHARCMALDADAPDTADTTPATYDLVLLHCAFASLAQARQALDRAARCLKPAGSLLLLGQTPAPWLDFVLGAQPPWWSRHPHGQYSGAWQGAAYWQAQLQALGLVCEVPLHAAPDVDAGTWLLLATRPAAALPMPVQEPVAETAPPPARAVLLLVQAEGRAQQLLAQAVQATLQGSGWRCHVCHIDESDDGALDASAGDEHITAALHAARAHMGALHDVLHLHGWGQDAAQSAAELTQRQVRRCALAAALLRACQNRPEDDITLWLVTSGMAPSAAPHTAPGDPLATINDAALWGYGRTLIHEAATTACRVRLLDVPAAPAALAAPLLEAPLLEALRRELFHNARAAAAKTSIEDEILLDASGARHAPRLRTVAAPPARQTLPAMQAARLDFDFPGQLQRLRWQPCAVREPEDGEVQVRIHASGLNFRDVMYALGLLSDEALENGFVGATLGLEFAGVVTRVGAHGAGWQPGDAVIGFGPASLATHTCTQAGALARIPPGVSWEAAASIPSTFFTVYYALHHLARLQAGERVLIHGAAGGVGLAAVQYAQHCGAHIYATAGTAEKRDLLRLMGVRHVYDSRTLDWADGVLRDTDGRGVDVVLNSLAGEAIRRNLRVLAPFGRFLELGKRDFYEDTRIGLRLLRHNISFFAIDADQLMRQRPDVTRRLLGELMDLFACGALHPLPYTAFAARDVLAAFRHMQQGGHIGKIVITYRDGIPPAPECAESSEPAPQETAALRLLPDASYLVTGGLSGFGLRTAQWLADKGARHLILTGRSGAGSAQARAAVAALQARGVQVCAAACDVGDHAALAALLAQSSARMPPLKGVVHAAAVIQDALAAQATPAQIAAHFHAKVLGARHLHALTRALPLDFFILYSSATTLFGNPGQSAYIAANRWLESLAVLRRAQHLPATCMRWGPIADAGFLARHEKTRQALQQRMGGAALPAAVALQVLENVLRAGDARDLAVLELDWRALARFLPGAAAPKFAALARAGATDGAGDDASADDSTDLLQLLDTHDDAALHPRLTALLKQELGDILRLKPERIDAARPLQDMGLDSLMAVELAVALENRFGVRLPVMALGEDGSVKQLAQRLLEALRSQHGAPDDAGASAAGDAAQMEQHITQLAARHGAAAETTAQHMADLAATLQGKG